MNEEREGNWKVRRTNESEKQLLTEEIYRL
jgi:hypothetical protein